MKLPFRLESHTGLCDPAIKTLARGKPVKIRRGPAAVTGYERRITTVRQDGKGGH